MRDGSPSTAPERWAGVLTDVDGSRTPSSQGPTPGAEVVRLETPHDELRRLVRDYCERFVDVTSAETAPTAAIPGRDRHELTIRLQLVEDDRGSLPEGLAEEWSGAPPRFTVRYGRLLESTADVQNATIDGWVCASLLRELPQTAGRLLVEGPLAAVRSGHGWQVVHGATVIGPAGAVVIRGASDSGKSTLAAAACRAGLEILGDESLLARRTACEEIAATVREVLVRPSVGEMMGLEGEPVVTSDGEPKLRLALPPLPVPKRSSAHAATVLLGDKDRTGGARLTLLEPRELETGFADGEIPQERWYGASPGSLIRHWGRRPAYRLDGSIDLEGAVALIGRLCRGESL